MSSIVVRGLHKHYDANRAVNGVDLLVEQGEVFALLGPNGAGKTTAVEILEGHRSRTAGEVEVLGHDPETGGRSFRERIGIVLQSSGIEKEFTVRELLTTYSPMFPRNLPIDRIIEVTGLSEKADARIKTLSGGQSRRVDLALGLIGDPELLFLDEPTTGFDPSARRRSWDLVSNLRSLGKTILLTTHYMDEAQNLADRLAVIVKGEIVAEGTPETIGGRAQSQSTITFRRPEGFDLSLITGAQLDGDTVTIKSGEPTAVLNTVTAWATERSMELEGLTVQQPSLEDVYLELIGDGHV
ncbi:MAG: ABC transporter ATP-binding protein [Acidimicrobiia bacterium]|nr:ABC transporter ATP-binding protein [Acidimicrobiia bacterium]